MVLTAATCHSGRCHAGVNSVWLQLRQRRRNWGLGRCERSGSGTRNVCGRHVSRAPQVIPHKLDERFVFGCGRKGGGAAKRVAGKAAAATVVAKKNVHSSGYAYVLRKFTDATNS